MNCRPRRLFRDLGQRIGINWLKQPRAQQILVSLPQCADPQHFVGDLHSDVIARAWEPSEFIRRQ